MWVLKKCPALPEVKRTKHLQFAFCFNPAILHLEMQCFCLFFIKMIESKKKWMFEWLLNNIYIYWFVNGVKFWMSQLLGLVWVMYFLAVRAYRTCKLTQRPRNWKRWRNWCRWMIRVSKTSSSPLRRGRGFAQCSELRTNHQWKWKHDSQCCPPRISKKKHRKPWLWLF